MPIKAVIIPHLSQGQRARAAASKLRIVLQSGNDQIRCGNLKSTYYSMRPMKKCRASCCAMAFDSLLVVRIPPTANKRLRIFGLAQVTQSHALSRFHLSSPICFLVWTPILQ